MDKKFFILAGMAEYERTMFLDKDFEKQSFPQKVFSSIWILQGEVDNGGFLQYFLNSSSNETASFVVEALNSAGLTATADICKRAIKTGFTNGLPVDSEQISKVVELSSDETRKRLQLLTYEFIQCPDDLIESLYQFIINNPDDFGPPPFPEKCFDSGLADRLNETLRTTDPTFQWWKSQE